MKKKLKGELKEFFDNFIKVLKRPDMAILPGQLAFFFVLAIVPTITLISYGATALNLSTDVIFDFLSNAFSKDIAALLLNVPQTDNISGLSFFCCSRSRLCNCFKWTSINYCYFQYYLWRRTIRILKKKIKGSNYDIFLSITFHIYVSSPCIWK